MYKQIDSNPLRKAAFFRNNRDSTGTHLVLGTWSTVPNLPLKESWKEGTVKGLEYYKDKSEVHEIITGFEVISSYFNDITKIGTLACADYYPW